MIDIYQIKAITAMQYEQGWTIAQENFNQYLNEQHGQKNPGRKMKKSFPNSGKMG